MATVIVRDLVAASKIEGAAKSSGVKIRMMTPENFDLEDDTFIVDYLDAYGGFYVARTVKAHKPSAKVIGFYPHVRRYIKDEAESIGCIALTNEEFFSRVKDIVRGKI